MASTTQYVVASAALGAGGVVLGMTGLGPLAFASAAAPGLLGAGGASLPGLWWLMKTVPPRPRLVDFPAIRLLFNLSSEDKQSASVPLWQRLLRLGAVAAVITGLSDPQFETPTSFGQGTGPVLLVVDNDWQSAKNWSLVRQRVETVLDGAARHGRSVMIMSTAGEQGQEIKPGTLQSAKEARVTLPGLEPRPWPSNREAALKALGDVPSGTSVVWFSNGQDDPRLQAFIQKLDGIGSLSVFTDQPGDAAHILSLKQGEELGAIVRRLSPGEEETVVVAAMGANGEIIVQTEAVIPVGQTSAEAIFADLPLELRRQIVKLSLPSENHAGATLLLDESWRKRTVGLLGSSGQGSLLEDATYIRPAIAPFTDLHSGSVEDLLKHSPSVIVMTDEAILAEDDRQRLQQWVDKGGMAVRFAGPRLAAQPGDSLISTPLVPGENHTTGTLSGTKATNLAPFANDSPFLGLKVPESLEIRTRVLSEPNLGDGVKIWAEFEDGVPFVTTRQQGEGWVVLVHTTANLEWSNLPLADDLFIEMMKVMVARSKSASAQVELTKPLPPFSLMDGRGRLGAASRGNIKLTRDDVKTGTVGPLSPPGFYGEQGSVARLAHNLYQAVKDYKPAPALPASVKALSYKDDHGPQNLKGIMLALAISLILADLIARLQQNGSLPGQTQRFVPREPEV